MIVTRMAGAQFAAEFESDDELRAEYRTNLSAGGLHLVTAETVAPNARMTVTLRAPSGLEWTIQATAVAQLPDGIAAAVEGDMSEIFDRLLPTEVAGSQAPVTEKRQPETASRQTESGTWDRIRALPQNEKILLATKADRSERAVLIQDNDPRVLLSVLRNPRLTIDEVTRIANSTFLNYQIADVILKTSQWSGNLDVRLGLIRNPKTPQPFALRILPTLPDAEVRAIARAGASMALKQAALRRLQQK